MQTHREKVLAHAAARLGAGEGLADPAQVSALLRSFLRVEDRRLKIAFRLGARGSALAAARSFALDLVVERAFRSAVWHTEGADFLGPTVFAGALVAVGGYGRGELAPFSDLDLLFLHAGRRTEQLRQLVERVLRLLWDAGLTVGHSFRAAGEAVSAARGDPHLQTALLDTRLIAGNGALLDGLRAALERERRRRSGEMLEALRRGREERHAKFGASVCVQEPNVKEGAGGLRELHAGLWAAQVVWGCGTLGELRARGLVPEAEWRAVSRAHDFLWRVRYASHLLTNRKTERLSLELQTELAAEFGYEAGPHMLASEKFMRDYYRHARELQQFGESMLARASAPETQRARRLGGPRGVRPPEPFSLQDGRLHAEGGEQLFRENPLLLFDAFALAQAACVPFDDSLRAAVRRSLDVVGNDFRASAEAAEAFLKLLRRRGRVGHALRLMHEVGFLGRYLPEFNRVSLLIQHDLYHHYTVDEHTLRAVEALDDLDAGRDPQRAHLRGVFDEIEDAALLYLSVLLHDIGKGRGSGHIPRGARIAGRVCQRLRLGEGASAKVVLLVKHHVTMAQLALRRDLNEPRVAAGLAAQTGSPAALNMLLLLTYADLNGVGPGVWSDWKGALLRELHRRARAHFGAGEADARHETVRLKEQIVAALMGEFPLSVVERHLALLPERYTRTTRPEAAAAHLRLIAQLGEEACRWRWQKLDGGTTGLMVCARDRHGLFADIAGTLAAHGVEILSAEVNTREDGVAVDVFTLREAATGQAVAEYRCEAVERALSAAVGGGQDVSAAVERWRTRHAPRRKSPPARARRRDLPRVACDNEASPAATLVEVHAADEPGLAYRIASALASLGLDIVCAKIATEKSDALDVFYVTDADGSKLSEAEARVVAAALAERLSAPVKNFAPRREAVMIDAT